MRDESPEPSGQDVAGDTEVLLELIEAVGTEEHLADDKHAPGIAEDVECTRDRAYVRSAQWIADTAGHAQSISQVGCAQQLTLLV